MLAVGFGLAVAHAVAAHRPTLSGARRRNRRLTSLLAVAAIFAGIAVSNRTTEVGINALGFFVGVRDSEVTLPTLQERSVVYAADGSVLAVLHDVNRIQVGLADMSPILVNAVIDTEDANFWHHGGVDVRGMLRAARKDLAAGTAVQGGSTITQQLVKQSLLSPKRSAKRKLREIVLADRLERRMGKKAILERYLNTVYLGEGSYGVEAAAQAYFGRSALQVDTAQAALLAGLIQSPTADDPIHDPAAAQRRRAEVIGRMVARNHLTPAAAAAAGAEPLPTTVNQPPATRDYATAAVVADLLDDDRLGATPEARHDELFGGGLQIHTTIDPGLQREAQSAVASRVPANGHLSAALAAVDPSTGAVRALVGGTDFATSQFDAASAGGRQPGSSFKTFTLVAALEAGRHLNDQVNGAEPCPVPNPRGKPNPWKPTNFEGEAFGRLSLMDATVHSVNCAFARVISSIGPQRVVDVAHSMGVTANLQPVPSLTLGTLPVPPLQMAGAYATLADDGTRHTTYVVDRVDGPNGNLLFANSGAPTPVLDPDIARQVTAALTGVVTDGTGRAAALADRPVAGKTGTADDYRDAWFVGYTPQLSTAVWFGDPSGEVPMLDVGGIAVVGGSYPASIWHDFMAAAMEGQPAIPFTPPATPVTGATPSDASARPGAGGPPVTTWCSASCGH
jgi:penicillin-binding protein 1A